MGRRPRLRYQAGLCRLIRPSRYMHFVLVWQALCGRVVGAVPCSCASAAAMHLRSSPTPLLLLLLLLLLPILRGCRTTRTMQRFQDRMYRGSTGKALPFSAALRPPTATMVALVLQLPCLKRPESWPHTFPRRTTTWQWHCLRAGSLMQPKQLVALRQRHPVRTCGSLVC